MIPATWYTTVHAQVVWVLNPKLVYTYVRGRPVHHRSDIRLPAAVLWTAVEAATLLLLYLIIALVHVIPTALSEYMQYIQLFHENRENGRHFTAVHVSMHSLRCGLTGEAPTGPA